MTTGRINKKLSTENNTTNAPKAMHSSKPYNPLHPFGTSFDPFKFQLSITRPNILQSPAVNVDAMLTESMIRRKP